MFKNLKIIFDLYGGFPALWTSSYFRISFVVTLLLWPLAVSGRWVDRAISILPSVTGFSIAAFAIILAIGDDRFRRSMAKVDAIRAGESDLVILSANFCWFICIQVFSMIYAVIFDARPVPYFCKFVTEFRYCDKVFLITNLLFSTLGLFIFIYAVFLIIASIFQMFFNFRLYIGSLTSPEKPNTG